MLIEKTILDIRASMIIRFYCSIKFQSRVFVSRQSPPFFADDADTYAQLLPRTILRRVVYDLFRIPIMRR